MRRAAAHMPGKVHMLLQDDSQESVPFFCHVGPRDQTQVAEPRCKCLDPQSSLACSASKL